MLEVEAQAAEELREVRVQPVNSGPALNPSKVTEPIITATNSTVPGRTSTRVNRDSGRPTPSTPLRRSSGDMRPNRLKYSVTPIQVTME